MSKSKTVWSMPLTPLKVTAGGDMKPRAASKSMLTLLLNVLTTALHALAASMSSAAALRVPRFSTHIAIIHALLTFLSIERISYLFICIHIFI